MCNLYANTMPQAAMRSLFAVSPENDRLGNAEPRRAIFPKYDGTVVRIGEGGHRELVDMHWGFVIPQKSKKTGAPIQPKAINNARDDKLLNSGFWRQSFEERRCLIPATSFCEAKGRAPADFHWFGVTDGEQVRPYAFAGIWKRHRGLYKDEMVDIETYSMVTSTPNDLVKPVHPDRMPVILPIDSYGTWLHGSPDDAFGLLKPYPEEQMVIIDHAEGLQAEP